MKTSNMLRTSSLALLVAATLVTPVAAQTQDGSWMVGMGVGMGVGWRF